MPKEEDGVNIRQARAAARGPTVCLERRPGNDRRVRPYICVVDSRLITQPLYDCQRVGDRVMLADAVARVRPRENDIGQHDSVSHALAVIERLGYESRV